MFHFFPYEEILNEIRTIFLIFPFARTLKTIRRQVLGNLCFSSKKSCFFCVKTCLLPPLTIFCDSSWHKRCIIPPSKEFQSHYILPNLKRTNFEFISVLIALVAVAKDSIEELLVRLMNTFYKNAIGTYCNRLDRGTFLKTWTWANSDKRKIFLL